MSSQNPIVEIQNLCAWYGPRQVLFDINFPVYANQIVALIGPSGCGKSTLARCINRIHEETPHATAQGKILFQGDDIYRKGSDPVNLRRKIGMVFQKPSPFPDMSVFENLSLGLKLMSVHSQADLGERVEAVLKQVGLWQEVKNQLHKPSKLLSAGQQQRLCIARALSLEPTVLLMDEPTSYLDPISSTKIEELVSELRKQVTVIIVTHNMQQAARISDYTGFFIEGRLIEFDKTSKLFTTPRDEKTELYITGRYE